MTKICPKCKKENRDTSQFCEECGKELSSTKKVEKSKSKNGFLKWWDKRNSKEKALTAIVACCVGVFLIIAISGMFAADKNTASTTTTYTPDNTKNTTATTPATTSSSTSSDNVLLDNRNVKMANGVIYVDNKVVGTYKTVSSPPAVSDDVDKRTWRDKRVEIVDFSPSDSKYLDYYTQYNGEWIKLSIDTTLQQSALEITDDIYTAMEG